MTDYKQAVRNRENVPGRITGHISVPPATKQASKKPDSRKIMFKEVKELQQKEFRPVTIAKKLGIARQTATKCHKRIRCHKGTANNETSIISMMHMEQGAGSEKGSQHTGNRIPRRKKSQDNRSALRPEKKYRICH